MPDAALSIASSPLAALLTGAPADSTPGNATAQPSDPFAALLASATGTKTATPAATADAVATLLASAAKIAPTPATAAPVVPAPVPSVAVVTPPTPAEALPVDGETALPVAEDTGTDDKDADTKDQSDDPLGDAIAAGATAVLAFAPVIVAPAPPQSTTPTPIKIDAPIAMTIQSKRQDIVGLQGGNSFKPVAQHAANADGKAADAAKISAAEVQATANPVKSADTAQAAANSDNAQTDSRAPRPPSSEAKPATTPLTQEMVKAVITTLKQGDGTTPAVDPAPTVPPVALTASAQAQKPQSPVSQQVQAEATASVQTPVRGRSDEVAAPRRPGDTRKRVETAAADAVSAGSSQRTAEPAVAFGREPSTIQPKGDAVVEQTLTVARDGAWLDTLARDIATSAGNGSDLQFKLDPQNLGSLTVAISQSADGASIRMTADNDTTRNLLLDAQPKLIAEARAQGLKVSDTHVDLKQDQGQNQSQNQSSSQDASRWAQSNGGQNGTTQNGQNRQSSPDHQPFVSNLGRKTEAESESLEGDSDALYA